MQASFYVKFLSNFSHHSEATGQLSYALKNIQSAAIFE